MQKHVPTKEYMRTLQAHIHEIGGEKTQEALSVLCAEAKKQAARQTILENLEESVLKNALCSETPKIRKNAARLMGALQSDVYAEALVLALQNEKTRLVRPSIVLALGSIGGETAARALQAHAVQEAETPEEEKHVREEKEALRRALSLVHPNEIPVFTGFSEPRTVFLTGVEGFVPTLLDELRALSIPVQQAGRRAVKLRERDITSLYRARCFMELLFPLLDHVEDMPEAVFKSVAKPFEALLMESHKEAKLFPYRIEYQGVCDRAAFVGKLAAAFDAGGYLKNSPSSYGAQLILKKRQDGLRAFCKLHTVPDLRHAYRKHALPASMHPVGAACLARYAATLHPSAKRVLDPCCGSGTLLIEYGLLETGAVLHGVDINEKALSFARENTDTAHIQCAFVHQDLQAYQARAPYDLVLANLPFGNRVGSHNRNERLYASLVDNLPDWLAPGGVAVLYTMEFTLLKKCLQNAPMLERIGGFQTAAGGLTPYVTAVRRK